MKCISCGTEMDENQLFCPNCGQRMENNIVQSVPISQATVYQQPTMEIPNEKSKPSKISVLSILTVLIVIILLILGGLLLFNAAKSFIENLHDPVALSGEQIFRTKMDPTGHKIKIITDSKYKYKVDVSYLALKKTQMQDASKALTQIEIENSNATLEQKKAMRILVYSVKHSSLTSKGDMRTFLRENGYSNEAIEYAMNNSGIDWEEQATITMLELLSTSYYSKESLIGTIRSKGYTQEDAERLVESQDFDYYEQATADACFLRYTYHGYNQSNDRETTKRILENSKYTTEEIEFALTTIYDEM